MVSKRSEYGFIGYDTPIIPRARRSIRKKRSSKKIFQEGQQLCAFELLATVAGKLLQEAEGSSTSSSAAVRPDGTHKDQLINRGVEERLQTYQDDHGSSEESVVSSGLRLLKCPKRDKDKKIFKNSSPVGSSACSIKISCSDMKSASNKCEDEFVHLPCKVDGGSPKCGESVGANVDNETPSAGDGDGGLDGEFLSAANKCRAKDDTVRFSGKLPTQKDLNNEVNAVLEQLPRGRGASIPDPSFIRHRNDVKLDSSRDDDEIFSRCSDPHSSNIKACRSTTPVGDRGPNKMLGSKYWKSVPKLDDCEASNNSAGENDTHRHNKFSYTHERLLQHTTPFKKRKLFAQSSVVTQDAGVSSESVSNSTKKVVYDNKRSPVLKPHKDNGVSSPTIDRQRAPASRNSHVKLSIKSFKVPELLIEVPDSTSVGSLKKTVLEAVTTVFGGGLRVGLLFNGKRVRDDSRTLLQAGLAGGDNLDNLGFLLEPFSPTTLPSSTLSPKVSPIVATDDSPKDFVNRPFLTRKEESNLIDLLDKKPVPNSTKVVAGNGRHDLVPFSIPLKSERKPVSDSRSLAALPEKVEPLAVVPAGQRPRRAEIGQRRTRQPFSVSEVEALVQAVEKLGTGRWRDVKLCAFENAKHRTYVDLKDKWKTLVHTARISPQQRRGEPVPQELLDRVLAAHAYWSQHQAKQHGKQQYQHHHHHHPHQASQIHVEKVAA